MASLSGLLGPRRTVEDALAATEESGFTLRKDLGRLDIMVFGIGVMVGAGIFILTGQAAATEAGPAVTLSFVLAAAVCVLCALSYAELAAMVPVGSAYTFSYGPFGPQGPQPCGAVPVVPSALSRALCVCRPRRVGRIGRCVCTAAVTALGWPVIAAPPALSLCARTGLA